MINKIEDSDNSCQIDGPSCSAAELSTRDDNWTLFSRVASFSILLLASFTILTQPAFAKKGLLASSKIKFKGPEKPNQNSSVKLDHPVDPSQVVPLLDEYLKFNPEDMTALKAKLSVSLQTGRFDEALIALNKLVELEPSRLEWLVVRGQTHEFLGNYEKAKQDYKSILAKEPYSAKAHQGLAGAMQNSGEGGQVLGMLEKSIADAEKEGKTTETTNLKLVLAQILALQGKLEEALAKYESLIENDPKDFRPHLCRGLVFSLMGDEEKAEASFVEFNKWKPKEYGEEYGLDDMVMNAKGAAMRLKEEKKRAERAAKKGRVVQPMQKPDPLSLDDGEE